MLKFSEQEEKFLKEFYKKQHSGSKDNVGTRDEHFGDGAVFVAKWLNLKIIYGTIYLRWLL